MIFTQAQIQKKGRNGIGKSIEILTFEIVQN